MSESRIGDVSLTSHPPSSEEEQISSDSDEMPLAPRGQYEYLELEKLRLEIGELRKSWWQRPSYLAALMPLLIAFIAVFAAWVNGFFDRQRIALENEKAELQSSIIALHTEIGKSQKKLVSAREDLNNKKRALADTQKALSKAEKSLANMQDTIKSEKDRSENIKQLLRKAERERSAAVESLQEIRTLYAGCAEEAAQAKLDFEKQTSHLLTTLSGIAAVFGAANIADELGSKDFIEDSEKQ